MSSASKREWRHKHPEQSKLIDRKRQLMFKYNLTIENWEEMQKNQDFKCQICGKHKDESPRGLYVDHDHDTGQVRDLLCNRCNLLVGMCDEKIEILEQVIVYLEKWKV